MPETRKINKLSWGRKLAKEAIRSGKAGPTEKRSSFAKMAKTFRKKG